MEQSGRASRHLIRLPLHIFLCSQQFILTNLSWSDIASRQIDGAKKDAICLSIFPPQGDILDIILSILPERMIDRWMSAYHPELG